MVPTGVLSNTGPLLSPSRNECDRATTDLNARTALMKESSTHVPTIVFSGDQNYTVGMAAALRSVLTHLRDTPRANVYILHPAFDSSIKDRLRAVVRATPVDVALSFVRVDEEEHLATFDLHIKNGWTHTIFYRPLIEKLIPECHERVLYLDCDIIVEEDLSPLLRTELNGQIVGAVPERVVSCPYSGLSRWKELGLPADAPYFNSGVMLIDMERWREEQVGRRVLEYLHEYGPLLNIKGNQGGFNAVLAGRWKPLPQKWNVQTWYLDDELYRRFGHAGVPTREELDEIRAAPAIIHYTHALKPWHVGCDHPHRDRFFRHLRRSGWFSMAEYAVWRSLLRMQDSMRSMKEVTRPLRHKIGLGRANAAT